LRNTNTSPASAGLHGNTGRPLSRQVQQRTAPDSQALRMATETISDLEQESPAVADKPARRESMPKIAPIRRAYNVVADNTGLSSFV